jgi:hypothetical protein
VNLGKRKHIQVDTEAHPPVPVHHGPSKASAVRLMSSSSTKLLSPSTPAPAIAVDATKKLKSQSSRVGTSPIRPTREEEGVTTAIDDTVANHKDADPSSSVVDHLLTYRRRNISYGIYVCGPKSEHSNIGKHVTIQFSKRAMPYLPRGDASITDQMFHKQLSPKHKFQLPINKFMSLQELIENIRERYCAGITMAENYYRNGSFVPLDKGFLKISHIVTYATIYICPLPKTNPWTRCTFNPEDSYTLYMLSARASRSSASNSVQLQVSQDPFPINEGPLYRLPPDSSFVRGLKDELRVRLGYKPTHNVLQTIISWIKSTKLEYKGKIQVSFYISSLLFISC